MKILTGDPFFTVRHNIFIGNSFETLRQGNGAKIIDFDNIKDQIKT